MRLSFWMAVVGLASSCEAGVVGFYGLTDYLAAVSVADNGTVLLEVTGGAYTWTVQGGVTPLLASLPSRISADGTVATGGGSSQAYRYVIPTHTFQPLPYPPGGFNTMPTGISADGSTIVGWDQTTNRGWRWTAATGTQTVGPAAPTRVYDVTRDGTRMTGSAGATPFVHTFDGGTVTLPAFNGREITELRKFSANGQVAVGAAYSIVSGVRVGEALLWTGGNSYQSLGSIGPVPGSNQAYTAFATNTDGTLIGGTQGGQRAWIWDPAHGMRDLRTVLITEHGYDLTDWLLETVTDISANGRYIVGQGAHFIGTGYEFRAFVAVIPAPSSALVLATILPLGRRRRRT
jgi:uncharacterized membrane protein